MPNSRRWHVEGGSYFFTVVTRNRQPVFSQKPAREILGHVLRKCQLQWPVEINAIVLLPDHLHAIWTLPPGDRRYSMRWGWIKKEFTKCWIAVGGAEETVSEGHRLRGDRGVWQSRFWEHTLHDEDDFERHFDYIHFNPVKHGYAASPGEWDASSFQRWVQAGVYEPDWGGGSTIPALMDSVGEPEDL